MKAVNAPHYLGSFAVALSLVLAAATGCKSMTNVGGGDMTDSAAATDATSSGTSTSTKDNKTISGRCEMVVLGSSDPKPCNDLTLTIHSQHTKHPEERTAQIDGFNFKFTDLTKNSYELVAASPNFQITTDTKELSPGQTVKIRVDAKPIQ